MSFFRDKYFFFTYPFVKGRLLLALLARFWWPEAFVVGGTSLAFPTLKAETVPQFFSKKRVHGMGNWISQHSDIIMPKASKAKMYCLSSIYSTQGHSISWWPTYHEGKITIECPYQRKQREADRTDKRWASRTVQRSARIYELYGFKNHAIYVFNYRNIILSLTHVRNSFKGNNKCFKT